MPFKVPFLCDIYVYIFLYILKLSVDRYNCQSLLYDIRKYNGFYTHSNNKKRSFKPRSCINIKTIGIRRFTMDIQRGCVFRTPGSIVDDTRVIPGEI